MDNHVKLKTKYYYSNANLNRQGNDQRYFLSLTKNSYNLLLDRLYVLTVNPTIGTTEKSRGKWKNEE